MKAIEHHCINLRGHLFSFARPAVMGIVNATPDSFYAASRTQTEQEIARRARQIVEQGGQLIDIGAFSTRPNARPVSEEEELRRMEMAVRTVRCEVADVPISVDTFRPEVARRCIEQWGADMVNDVGSIATEPEGIATERKQQMFSLVAQLGVPYILMSQASDMVQMMQQLAADVERLYAMGQKDVLIDPGFGFGKTQQQNYEVLSRLDCLAEFGLPVLVGLSRKSMLRTERENTDASQLNATTALHMACLERGASVLRVHDVAEAVQTVNLFERLRAAQSK